MSAEFDQAVEAFRNGDLERARVLAEAQLSAASSPKAQHLLGLIHCRLGDPASGVEHLTRAAEAEPENGGFRIMLLRALVDAGRAVEVVQMPEPPAIHSAATLELWRVRAEAADAAGKAEISIDAWSKVASAAPADWKAWANLGNTYATIEAWREAADALSKAAALNPRELAVQRNAGSAFLHFNAFEDAIRHLTAVAEALPNSVEDRIILGHALAGARRYDDAIAEFESARRFGVTTFDIEFGIGQSHAAKMRFAEAEPALERAYALEPANRAAIFQYGLVLDRNNKVERLAKLLREALALGIDEDSLNYLWAVLARREGRLDEAHELLLRSEPDKDDPVAWHHLRAKIADGLGNAEEAFEAAMMMNRMSLELTVPAPDREAWRQRAIAYRNEQHELARTITARWASSIPVLNEPAPRKLAFLVGFPRSGTTLLDTFLMGHDEIVVLEEEQLVGKAALGVKVKDLPGASLDFVKRARATYLGALSQLLEEGFAGVVIDKFPLDMAAVPLIHAMFPGAPIIFAQRHPCDVVLSGFMQTFGMVNFGTIEDAADYYDAMMSIWTASRNAMKLNIHTVVYEEFIEKPEAVLRGVIDFLGLEWNERVLDHRRTARSRGTISTPSYDQVTEPISKTPSGRWKRYREQMRPALPLLLSWAERLGYRG